MKRFIIPIIIVIVAILNVNAQRVSTQQFLVRKITFQATDPIVPINGISVEINKAKFRSDKSGQFTANIPVSKDMGFYISSITAPGYIVSIPEDLSKKIFLSSNECIIVLADINAVKAEKNRIYNNNKAALAKQEERLNNEVKRNQELLNKIEKQETEYNFILTELEKAKRQLESFNDSKANLEEKIDSLSDNLSMIDYASLSSQEQIRIKKEKDGEWIDAIVDEVISKLEMNLNAKHNKELIEIEKAIKDISSDYYQKFINGNLPSAINYFTYHYNDYLRTSVSDMRMKKDKVLDRILEKILDEDLENIVKNNIDSCQNKWKVKTSDSNSEYVKQDTPKTLTSAKEDFLSWALYPDKEFSLRKVMKPHWDISNVNKGIDNTLKNVYSNYYIQGKNAADKYVIKYKITTKDELYKFSDESIRAQVIIEIQEVVREKFIELSDNLSFPYFGNVLISCVAEESLEPLRKAYNELIDNDFKEANNATFQSIESKIQPISQENRHKYTLSWDSNKSIEEYKKQYIELKKEYPEYTSFLYPIVMQFMQPIIKKYDCDEALYTWKSSMEHDVLKYCYHAIRQYSDKLSYIPNVAGSNDKCMDIVRAIIEVEEEKIVINHNERLKNINELKAKEELDAIANMKSNKNRFDKEEDIIAFLATHKFVNKESGRSSWYNSKISKWYMNLGYGEACSDISFTIIEWNNNSAKLKLKIDRGAPVIINIQLNSNTASYSESCGGMTIIFSAIDK